ALGAVSQTVNSTLDLQTVLSTIVAHANRLSGTDGAAISEYDDATQELHVRTTHQLGEELIEALRATPFRLGEGALGRAVAARKPVQIPDITNEEAYQGRARDAVVRAGFRALLAIPLLQEEHIIGGLTVLRKAPGEFPSELVELLQTFATQSALA